MLRKTKKQPYKNEKGKKIQMERKKYIQLRAYVATNRDDAVVVAKKNHREFNVKAIGACG